MPKQVRARASSTCPLCARRISVGTTILKWYATGAWCHAKCVVGAAEAKKPVAV